MSIRFAHRYRILDILFAYRSLNDRAKEQAAEHQKVFFTIVQSATSQQAKYLTELKERIDGRMFLYLLASDPLMWLITIVGAFIKIAQAFHASPIINNSESEKSHLSKNSIVSEIETLVWASADEEELIAT